MPHCGTGAGGLSLGAVVLDNVASRFNLVPFSFELKISSFKAVASTNAGLRLPTLAKIFSCPHKVKRLVFCLLTSYPLMVRPIILFT